MIDYTDCINETGPQECFVFIRYCFLLSISYVEPVKFLKQTSPENVLKTRQKLQNELYFWICVLSDVSGILEEKYDLHLNLFPNVISL